MAKVTVKIYTVLGKKLINDERTFDASDVDDALESLAASYGRKFREEVYDGGEVRNNYVLLLNGAPLQRDDLKSRRLKDGDILLIFPPVSGG